MSLNVDIECDCSQWDGAADYEALGARACAAIGEALGGDACGEAAVLLTDNEAMRALNQRFRDKDKPTNVLSFPAPPLPSGIAGGQGDAHIQLGDIALGFEIVKAEADAAQKPFADHVAHLLVHGILHLLGFDHEASEEAEEMEALEVRILAELGIPDPYAEASGVGDVRPGMNAGPGRN